MKFFSAFRDLFSQSAHSELAQYLQRWILHGRCPVCQDKLNSNHSVAHVGSCNFPGPTPENGFIGDIKARNWREIIKPFYRIASMDLMACEVIRCPKRFSLLAWVEVDLVLAGDQYSVYTESINAKELSGLEEYVALQWQAFK